MKSILGSLAVLAAVYSSSAFAQDLVARAQGIQKERLGIDGHNDTIQHVIYENVDLANPLPNGMIDFPRLQEGSIQVPFFALWVPTYYKGSEAVRRTLDLRDAMRERSPAFVSSADGIGTGTCVRAEPIWVDRECGRRLRRSDPVRPSRTT